MVVDADGFAKIGEIVTCEAGHEICEVASALVRHERISHQSFTKWRFEELERANSGSVLPCPQCGALYIRGQSFRGADIHFQDGWRLQNARMHGLAHN